MKTGILYQNFWPEEKIKEALPVIAGLGCRGVQLYVTKSFSPENLSGTGRKDIRNLLAKHGLALPAVCADYGKGFVNPEWAEWSLEKVSPCFPLARDLGTDVVTTHFGKVPQDRNDPARKALVQVVKEVAGRALDAGCRIATETGAEDPAVL
ncbi:MAG TPA: hypothetical protein ENN09_07735, partial [Planctomycetes bacterium]|nr:hypothetical protein [Planctomycetota bacterium]